MKGHQMNNLAGVSAAVTDLLNAIDNARETATEAQDVVLTYLERQVETALDAEYDRVVHGFQDAEQDEDYERAASRARSDDFAETGGRDWT